MANLPVKWFSSDMGGHPVLTDTGSGDFIGLLKACLITGFNTRPIGTLTYDSQTGLALADVGTGHGYLTHQVVDVSGATETEFNGQVRIVETGTSWFKYVPDTAPAVSAATGTTIEAKAAPVGGWEIVAEDAANFLIAIRSTAPDASPHTYMILNDGRDGNYSTNYNNGNIAEISILESFTDFATHEKATGHWWPASHRQSSEEWMLAADDKTIFWVCRYAYQNKRSVFVLGDIETLRPGDTSYAITNGIETGAGGEWDTSDSPYSDFLNLGSTAYRDIARAHSQLPGSVAWSLYGLGNTMGASFAYPNPATNGFYCATGKLMVLESGGLRGFMPGVLQPLQTSSVYHKAVVKNLPDLENIPVLFWKATTSRSYVSGENLIAFRLDQWRPEVGA